MKTLDIPLWMISAMEQADFTDGDRGQLIRMLYEYFYLDKMPEENDLVLGKMVAAFYFAVSAIQEDVEK